MVVGGRTGRDGIHGATFSSGQLTHEHETIFSRAVQIGNAITEKKMLDVLVQAPEAGLYNAITDCGAGGLSSAVGEMGEELGAEVDLEKVPAEVRRALLHRNLDLRGPGAHGPRRPAREPRSHSADLRRRERRGDGHRPLHGATRSFACATTASRWPTWTWSSCTTACREYSRQAVWQPPQLSEPILPEKDNYTDDLLQILSSCNVASKEWVIRQYDHEVQGGTVVKPLVGVANDGPSDAAVLRPVLDSQRGLAITCGMNPLYGDIDPYWMAWPGSTRRSAT